MNNRQILVALEALKTIASWPEGPQVDASFDEPKSAKTARTALGEILDIRGTALECLVTGCALIDPATDRVVWGDLHAVAGVGIFNACLNPNHESAWVELGPMLDATPSCTLADDQQFFERRAVIVFDLARAELNTAAKQRMVPR
jgi:hypothetical protein